MLDGLSDALQAVTQPIEEARGLPNRHYNDPAVFAEEREALFFKTWAAIGFGKDLPGPGDAKPLSFLGVPLLAVRDRDGVLRVFQNTCRHRGMILVDEPTTIRGAIRCPYHSWAYGLDGSLRRTPHVGGSGQNSHPCIKRDELGLIEIRSTVWQDVIFVNLDGEAPPFEVHAADLIARWKEFERPLHHAGADSSFSLEVACNWKLAVENYCESYHLPWVHPGLNSYSKLEDHYHIEAPGRFSGQGTLVYRPMIDESGNNFAPFAGLSEKWDSAGEYIALYPNVLFGVHHDHVYAILLEPVNETRTIERVEIYYADESMRNSDWAGMRAANTRLWRGVFEEDVFVVEGMQRGRFGSKFDGGKFSPAMDGPTHCFHHWVATQMSR
ncbi:MAG: aromatic ring-hydroxylating dioxygenase subunit alpha [Rhodospirillales bacterium]